MVGWGTFSLGGLLNGPALADGGSVAAVSRIKDHMEVWWIAPNGSVHDAYRYSTQTPNWKTFELAPEGSADVKGGITAVTRAPGTMEVWWIGRSGSVEGAFWYEGTGKWTTYELAPKGSAVAGSSIYAQSRIPTAMNVWWIGVKSSVEGCFFVENAPQPWTRYRIADEGSAAPKTSITAVSRIPGSEELWWVSSGGSVEGAFWYDGKPWQRYQIAPNGSAAIGAGLKARARLSNLMDLFWIQSDGSVQVATVITDKSPPWTRYQLAGPNSASVQGGLTAVSRIPSTQEVWWVGPRGELKDAFWFEGSSGWKFFDLANAGSARLNSKLASISRIAGSMEVWFASAQGELTDQYWYDTPHYDFSVDKISCMEQRSRNSDTLHIATSVAVAGRPTITKSQHLGDHGIGFTFPDVALRNIPVEDGEIAVFTYIIINNGHDEEGKIQKTLEEGANKLASNAASSEGKDIGAAIGAVLGLAVPVVGTLVGAYLGAVAQVLLTDLFGSILPNCDGPIASAAQVVPASDLNRRLSAGEQFGTTDTNPGVTSPHGCGANSSYTTTWSVKKSPE
ncbi:MAG: hypothetical protein M4579_000263 [Chaenotheca gracillima]|nr:MAG: hypothetical protein M4579_000263 [Chaenotheca gracillima]